MRRRFLLLCIVLGLLFTACGSAASTQSTSTSGSTPTSASPSHNPTPATINGPTVLEVTRTDPSPTNNLGPIDKTVTGVASVQNLYRMALALPAYATQVSISQSCLNDLGVIYHLDFRQGETEIRHMNLDPGECKILYVSQTDLRQLDDAFIQSLEQALQVNSLTSNAS